jgi:Fur family transcriptional regulator, ferric uptake regulator
VLTQKAMIQKTQDLLKQFGLRQTDCREAVLKIFIVSEYAVSNADIEQEIAQNYDRVTVYRTLRTFLDKGIIHKVLDDASNPKYALCKDACTQHDHHHQHVHFKCDTCGHTLCLEKVSIPTIELPQGYQFVEANLLVNGICNQCSEN